MDIETREKVIGLFKKNLNGVSDKVIKKNFPEIDSKNLVELINTLLTEGLLTLLKTSNNTILYKYNFNVKTDEGNLEETDEKLVFKIIKDSGNLGIWIRDIRYKSNLLLAQLNKIIKSLENKKMIKSVKTLSASKKKLYMVYDLEPDQSLTGGAWYSDQEFEAEFVQILSQQCIKFINQEIDNRIKHFVSTERVNPLTLYVSSLEILKYISDIGISKIPLKLSDIETILDTLMFDMLIEKITLSKSHINPYHLNYILSKVDTSSLKFDKFNLYKPLKSYFKSNSHGPFVVLNEPNTNEGKINATYAIPCATCPTLEPCSEKQNVNPIICNILDRWTK